MEVLPGTGGEMTVSIYYSVYIKRLRLMGICIGTVQIVIGFIWLIFAINKLSMRFRKIKLQ